MSSHVITSSAATLSARIASSITLFSPVPAVDTVFFNEGPRRLDPIVTTSLSGAMDTTAIDAYTQGVELTSEDRYVAGVAKIWSGEPGHVLHRNRFGMDRNTFPGLAFADLDLFNPGTFIRAQATNSPLWSSLLSFPIVIGNNDQQENFNFDGVIEPLSIRRPASFTSIESPHESHSVKAAFGVGNIDHFGKADQVLSITYVNSGNPNVPFFDLPWFENGESKIAPFSDARIVRNKVPTVVEGNDLLRAMSLMSGSTDDYVHYNQRSAACGWVYDNTMVGVDSIAFGGLTF